MKHFFLLSLTSLCSLSTIAMEVVPCSSKDEVRLLHSPKTSRLYVEDENAAYRVETHEMNTLLRDVVKLNAMKKFIASDGYIRANKYDDGKYLLAAKVRGNGGTGPITAFTAGLLVRVGCYTGYMLAASTPVIVGTATTGPGGGVAAAAGVQVALTAAGGAAGIIASTESLANTVSLAVLAFPFPLP